VVGTCWQYADKEETSFSRSEERSTDASLSLLLLGRQVEYYDMLQNTVGGGKPKMFFHFRNTTGVFPEQGSKPAPATAEEQQALIDALQTYKTATYKKMLETQAKPRPGVLELMDEALDDERIAVGICSASTKEAALKTLDITLGPERVKQLDVCILGDDVSAKKPDPLIYNTARERLGMSPEQCVVIEDSLIGLQAAVRANMKCLITYTSSTADMDFYGEGALACVPDLASRKVTLSSIFDPLREHGLDADILPGIKDPLEVATS
jgi:HAD superfamily hydrolase (TIGR01509 family)